MTTNDDVITNDDIQLMINGDGVNIDITSKEQKGNTVEIKKTKNLLWLNKDLRATDKRNNEKSIVKITV